MKKFLSFLLMIAAFLSLGIYSSFADETGVDFHSDSPPFEAAGLVGLMDGNVLRFDDFSFSITAPNQKCADGWGKRTVPETISDLNDSIKASADSNLILLWDDFTAEQGSTSLSVSISPCESTAAEKDLLSWAKGYFEKADGVSVCEFVTLPLGDMKDQLCLHVSFVYDDNHEEDLLVINKKHGEYCLGCEIRTYGWKGALEEAEQLIFVNAPNELPFAILDSGRLIIKDKTIFGKTAEELGPCFDFFPTPTEFPWWDIPLTCSNMDCDGYNVSLLFDSDDRLYCVMCEEVEKEKFETAFDEAKIDSNDIYYYYLYLNTEFFVDGKKYEFMADDDLTFDFALCNDQKGGVAISQRYFGEAVTDEKILTFANAILDGTLSDLTPDHAMKLAEFASDRSGDAENMLITGNIYFSIFNNEEKAAEWYQKAADAGSEDAKLLLGSR